MTSEGHKMDPTEFEEKSNFVLSKTPAGKLIFSPARLKGSLDPNHFILKSMSERVGSDIERL